MKQFLLTPLLLFFTACGSPQYYSDSLPGSPCQTIQAARPAPNMQLASPLPVTNTFYIVKPGDSLWRIADDYSISIYKLMKTNNISSPLQLKTGRKLIIPEANPPASTGSLCFLWPLKGEILNRFGESNNKINNSGINIKANNDDRVTASENGEVVFCNFLNGWGHTVIVKHLYDFYTIYTNLSTMLVQEGSSVKKGQTIAKVASGVGAQDQILHFEIRKRHLPQNPLQYLTRPY